MFGIGNLALIPLRAEASDRSEMISQVLLGEHFKILEQQTNWVKIELHHDQYQGWIDRKQFQPISETTYKQLCSTDPQFNGDLVEFIAQPNHSLMTIPLGASVHFLHIAEANIKNWNFEGSIISGVQAKSQLIPTAYMYLNAPYLWGGRSPFGIDCSGFVQMVYRINGYSLPRDAYQQAVVGYPLSFIEEAEPGDLAFFDNEEGRIVHVGIIMDNNYIIHASGQVRIDRLDHLGIYNPETNRHTHKLRVIKKII